MISIEAHHVQNLGDHGREVTTAFPYIEGETVDELVARIGDKIGPFVSRGPSRIATTDFIILRRIEETE